MYVPGMLYIYKLTACLISRTLNYVPVACVVLVVVIQVADMCSRLDRVSIRYQMNPV